jgi:hypothetical protein
MAGVYGTIVQKGVIGTITQRGVVGTMTESGNYPTWDIFWKFLTSGLIWYRRELNDTGGYFVLSYSSDGGGTWTELLVLALTEDSVIIDRTHVYNHRIVGTEYRVDNLLTALGYAGVEGVDWENLYST